MIADTLRADTIPEEIRRSTRAVAWNYEIRDGHSTKVPYQTAAPRRRAGVDDAETWGPFASAISIVEEGQADGVGFVLGDGYAGVDIDQCRDPETGHNHEAALAIIRALDSYSEVSPSGTGIKIFMRGALPQGRRRKGHVEMYDSARYFTVTGHHVHGTPTTIEDRTAELGQLHASVFPVDEQADDQTGPTPSSTTIDIDDASLVSMATRARNGAKVAPLWNGSWRGEYTSQSEADLALCNLLAFWTGRDGARMDSLFRQSGLMRDKWDQRHYASGNTYGTETINKAIAECRDVYRKTDDGVKAPTPSAHEAGHSHEQSGHRCWRSLSPPGHR